MTHCPDCGIRSTAYPPHTQECATTPEEDSVTQTHDDDPHGFHEGCGECVAEASDDLPTYVPTIELIGYDESGESGGDVYEIRVDGEYWKVEQWHTHNSDGVEFYDQTGAWHSGPFDEDKVDIDAAHGRLDAVTQAFDTVYYPLWRDQVQPVLLRITAEAIEATNTAVTQTQEEAPSE